MVPFLTSPLALVALIGVPVLVAIYLFQRRFRTLEVSSLLLWDAVKQPSMGGRRRERLRLPLSFWLEALAVVLLALAAAGPLIARFSRARPLAIVCDDSLSMRGAARDRALAFVKAELERRNYAPVRVIFAGQRPQLGELSQWSCNAAAADLDAAVAMASQTMGPDGLVLVLTDHAPEHPLEPGRVKWQAFGEPRANLAFVAATRKGDRALVEIANYSNKPAAALGVTIAPNARHRLELRNASELTLPDDAADFDNRVTLLPDQRRPLRVAVRVSDPELKTLVETALTATKRVTFTGQPELILGDAEIVRGPSGAAFVGPYVVDRTHPLAAGLALDGVVWGAARGPLSGDAIVTVGAQKLLAVEGDRVHMRFEPSISNFHRTPAWPALFWNLVEWRSAQTPGPRTANAILGSDVEVRVEGAVTITAPDGTKREADARSGSVIVPASMPGIWRVNEHAFAVNALVPGESDLTRATSGTWGGWTEDALSSAGYESAAWIALLLALATLAVHQRFEYAT
jgi:Aerotolerance regulator N-terminal